jgi:hypothetical protein
MRSPNLGFSTNTRRADFPASSPKTKFPYASEKALEASCDNLLKKEMDEDGSGDVAEEEAAAACTEDDARALRRLEEDDGIVMAATA